MTGQQTSLKVEHLIYIIIYCEVIMIMMMMMFDDDDRDDDDDV